VARPGPVDIGLALELVVLAVVAQHFPIPFGPQHRVGSSRTTTGSGFSSTMPRQGHAGLLSVRFFLGVIAIAGTVGALSADVLAGRFSEPKSCACAARLFPIFGSLQLVKRSIEAVIARPGQSPYDGRMKAPGPDDRPVASTPR